MTYREICLQEAKRVVCQSREREYGSPEDSFRQIRELWEAYLGVNLAPHDVAMMMTLLKIARIKNGNFRVDSFVDAAGYIACGYEIARRCEVGRAESGEGSGTGDGTGEQTGGGTGGGSGDGSGDGSGEQAGDRDEARAGGEAREETGKRGDSEARSENDTPPDTDTQTDTDPQTKTQTTTQTQFQFGVRDGETKAVEEREAEIESCVAYGLQKSQKAMEEKQVTYQPVFRDAQRGVGVGFAYIPYI